MNKRTGTNNPKSTRRDLLSAGAGVLAAASVPTAVFAAARNGTQSARIERSVIDTGLPYAAATAAFERSIGRLDVDASRALRARKAPWADVERAMARMAGPSGLMLFTQIDQGAIASLAGTTVQCRLYLIGNPAIATQIVRIDVRGCFYVPFRVAIYESQDESGAIICFDRPSSFLGALERPELADIGRLLDAKIDAVVQRVRAGAGSKQFNATPTGC
jgi:uncharacterized protein (DUF302 family)